MVWYHFANGLLLLVSFLLVSFSKKVQTKDALPMKNLNLIKAGKNGRNFQQQQKNNEHISPSWVNLGLIYFNGFNIKHKKRFPWKFLGSFKKKKFKVFFERPFERVCSNFRKCSKSLSSESNEQEFARTFDFERASIITACWSFGTFNNLDVQEFSILFSNDLFHGDSIFRQVSSYFDDIS